jgi:hypothetical protein
MDESKSDAELLERAEKRVKQKVRLLYSAGLWVVFSVFFFLIWLLTGRGYQWFWWPIAGLGFALFIQVVGYFSGNRGIATHDRMVEKEMERMKKDG